MPMDYLRDAAGPGRALVYTITAVDRTDHPAGKNPGGPGKRCDEYIECGEDRKQCKFEQVVACPSCVMKSFHGDASTSVENALQVRLAVRALRHGGRQAGVPRV